MSETLSEVIYGDDELGNHKLSDICDGRISYNTGEDPKKWTYVRAQTGDRGSMIKSRGLYVVLETKKYDPIIEKLETEDKETNHFSLSEIVEAMPRKERQSKTTPSIRGEYLTVKEIYGQENENGEIEVKKSSGFTSSIPVEYVIEPMTYDQVIVELIDETLESS